MRGSLASLFSLVKLFQHGPLALFVLGAIRAESIVIQRVAEALLAESDAKASSIERRLERFLSNDRIKIEETWNDLLEEAMPFFRGKPMRLIIDVTPYEEHAQVIYIGLLQHSRVLPLAWKVMPGQEKWKQGWWACVEELFRRLAPHMGKTDCTILGDSAFGCFPMVKLCEKYGWHYLFRICADHPCEGSGHLKAGILKGDDPKSKQEQRIWLRSPFYVPTARVIG